MNLAKRMTGLWIFVLDPGIVADYCMCIGDLTFETMHVSVMKRRKADRRVISSGIKLWRPKTSNWSAFRAETGNAHIHREKNLLIKAGLSRHSSLI